MAAQAEPQSPLAREARDVELNVGPDEAPSSKSRFLWVPAWALAGVIEGYIIVKALVPYPKVLVDQFVFKNCVVLKMFMSAVGCAMFGQAIMSHFAPERFDKSRSYGREKFGYLRVIAGTGILGCGMAIAGNGPTMVAPAIGGFIETSWALVLGGLAGAFIVALIDKILESMQKDYKFGAKPAEDPLTAEGLVEWLTGKQVSYKVLASAMGFFMIGATVALEIAYPFADNVEYLTGISSSDALYSGSILNYPCWPPILAGAAVGFGQIPVRFATEDGMGGATAFAVIISTFTGGLLSPNQNICKNLANLWQLTYNYVFVLAGALLARALNEHWMLDQTGFVGNPSLTDGFTPIRMAIGACMAVLGGRVAGGCTCGHGVSGTSELSIESFTGAASIFGCAIITRMIMVHGLKVDY